MHVLLHIKVGQRPLLLCPCNAVIPSTDPFIHTAWCLVSHLQCVYNIHIMLTRQHHLTLVCLPAMHTFGFFLSFDTHSGFLPPAPELASLIQQHAPLTLPSLHWMNASVPATAESAGAAEVQLSQQGTAEPAGTIEAQGSQARGDVGGGAATGLLIKTECEGLPPMTECGSSEGNNRQPTATATAAAAASDSGLKVTAASSPPHGQGVMSPSPLSISHVVTRDESLALMDVFTAPSMVTTCGGRQALSTSKSVMKAMTDFLTTFREEVGEEEEEVQGAM